jgi:hypothetical protein
MNQPTPPIRAPFTAPCYAAGSVVIDKTGTVFLAGRSAIQQVQDYLNDLTVYIRSVTGK